MTGTQDSDCVGTHKEAGLAIVARDGEDIQKLVSIVAQKDIQDLLLLDVLENQ